MNFIFKHLLVILLLSPFCCQGIEITFKKTEESPARLTPKVSGLLSPEKIQNITKDDQKETLLVLFIPEEFNAVAHFIFNDKGILTQIIVYHDSPENGKAIIDALHVVVDIHLIINQIPQDESSTDKPDPFDIFDFWSTNVADKMTSNKPYSSDMAPIIIETFAKTLSVPQETSPDTAAADSRRNTRRIEPAAAPVPRAPQLKALKKKNLIRND